MTYQRLPTGEWHYTLNASMPIADNPEDLPKLSQHRELVRAIAQVNFDLTLSLNSAKNQAINTGNKSAKSAAK
ncbi:hypothetical protein GX563_08145 [Candidatus Bathyarchaeota archaeon]|nr:hypothetical protein [Candidatus Bathyarchaeota archaeon]